MAGEHRINRLLILGIGSVLGIYACVQAAAEETARPAAAKSGNWKGD